jgi:hypothetical protein
MTTMPLMQNILQGILQTEDKSKQNQKKMGYIKSQDKSNQRLAVIWLHIIKSLNNKQLNGRNHHIPTNIHTECQ